MGRIMEDRIMTDNNTTTLLTAEERTVCEQINTQGESPHNQRAQVLLAIDAGSSQAQAAEQSGLTIGQVRYCLRRFRELRLGIFPEIAQSESKAEAVTTTPAPSAVEVAPDPVVEVVSEVPEPVASTNGQPKVKKAKKSKKDEKKEEKKKAKAKALKKAKKALKEKKAKEKKKAAKAAKKEKKKLIAKAKKTGKKAKKSKKGKKKKA